MAGGVGERAVRASERRRYVAEQEYLRLSVPAGAAVEAARFVRRSVWERFRVSGGEVRIDWLSAPPRGSVAQLVLEDGVRMICVLEGVDGRRQPPVCRYWLDGWPGAVEVYDLADLAGLAGEPVAA